MLALFHIMQIGKEELIFLEVDQKADSDKM